MQISVANVTLENLSPYSQSRYIDQDAGETVKKNKEAPDAYDARIWRHKMSVSEDGSTVVIPAHGMHQCLADASSYVGERIAGKGMKTWAQKFRAGVSIIADIPLNIDPADVQAVKVICHSQGRRGPGARVVRRFPQIPSWSATFDILVLDLEIDEKQMRSTIEAAGLFVGIGRFRPQNTGTNGRFALRDMTWRDRIDGAAFFSEIARAA